MDHSFGRRLHREGAFAQLVRGKVKQLEIGRINDVYFMETMSFGLDAAIAADTTKRRDVRRLANTVEATRRIALKEQLVQ